MGLSRSSLAPAGTPLRGFGGGAVNALGQISLPVTFGTGFYARTEDITFDVVDIPYPYNTIFGRRLLNAFYAVPHHGFLYMKMSGPRGIINVLGDQELARLIDVGRAPEQREVNELTLTAEDVDVSCPLTTRFVPRAQPEGVSRAFRSIRSDPTG
ncbi:unnamed protein product [Urochloa humidicola]